MAEALVSFQDWCQSQGAFHHNTTPVTYDNWDLGIAIPAIVNSNNLPLPSILYGDRTLELQLLWLRNGNKAPATGIEFLRVLGHGPPTSCPRVGSSYGLLEGLRHAANSGWDLTTPGQFPPLELGPPRNPVALTPSPSWPPSPPNQEDWFHREPPPTSPTSPTPRIPKTDSRKGVTPEPITPPNSATRFKDSWARATRDNYHTVLRNQATTTPPDQTRPHSSGASSPDLGETETAYRNRATPKNDKCPCAQCTYDIRTYGYVHNHIWAREKAAIQLLATGISDINLQQPIQNTEHGASTDGHSPAPFLTPPPSPCSRSSRCRCQPCTTPRTLPPYARWS